VKNAPVRFLEFGEMVDEKEPGKAEGVVSFPVKRTVFD